ncbi:unnamed protein product [Protopolystoma xenopodis]|uniref:Uncharacterized protein n=1 Tax=Protopolystoma xenopodis TaxID=117903 RepID=A0A448XSR8_9PLAT|nr:unnamed protein product [Protopolystoma xenopodis]
MNNGQADWLHLPLTDDAGPAEGAMLQITNTAPEDMGLGSLRTVALALRPSCQDKQQSTLSNIDNCQQFFRKKSSQLRWFEH